ncbi:MAG TPA: TIGR02444 family protein [Dongiaceae bacterium]|nr:TIGR02444 family protein [Dongiaceae bacterium]
MNFWSFSLQLYGKPGVAEACIALQDGLGLDVNLLLFCCWHGRALRKLDEAGLRQAIATVEAWQSEVVKPLRAVRRRLKAGVAPITARECQALRHKVNDLELESERIAQSALEALPMPPPGWRPAVEANLDLYLTLMRRDPAKVPELQVLVEASA